MTENAREAGTRNRRQVLGDAHVDRSIARTLPFDKPFQDMITRYCWGEVWDRPGLNRRTRSLLTMAMLLAQGHDEEFRLHVRGSANCGVSREEVTEMLLQATIYCGVPSANTGFRLAKEVFAEMDAEAGAG